MASPAQSLPDGVVVAGQYVVETQRPLSPVGGLHAFWAHGLARCRSRYRGPFRKPGTKGGHLRTHARNAALNERF